MTTVPSSGFSRPISVFKNTDLPVPEGPSMTEISPGGRVRVTSPQMSWSPKDLLNPSTCTATPTHAPPLPAGNVRRRAASAPLGFHLSGPYDLDATVPRLSPGHLGTLLLFPDET